MYRIRPVPVVFLLLAFMPQLSVKCKVCVSWEFVLCRGRVSDSGRMGGKGMRAYIDGF